MTTNSITLPPPSMPLITPDSKIERAWYLCLRQIIQSLGGFNNSVLLGDDLQTLTDENQDIATADNQSIVNRIADLEAKTADNDLQNIPALQDVIDALMLAQTDLDDATFASALSNINFGNPTSLVGLIPINGTLNKAMRSDGAPALDQSIAPTWTGVHAMTATPLVNTVTHVATGLANKKTSDTSSANATLTADAALTVTINETGYYTFEVMLVFYEPTVSTGGFQFDLNAGTAVLGGILGTIAGFITAAVSLAAITSATTATGFGTISGSATAPSWVLVKGSIYVTTAGTFGVRWAQNSALPADITILKFISYITLIKVG